MNYNHHPKAPPHNRNVTPSADEPRGATISLHCRPATHPSGRSLPHPQFAPQMKHLPQQICLRRTGPNVQHIASQHITWNRSIPKEPAPIRNKSNTWHGQRAVKNERTKTPSYHIRFSKLARWQCKHAMFSPMAWPRHLCSSMNPHSVCRRSAQLTWAGQTIKRGT